MTTKQVLAMMERFQTALSLLCLHGLVTSGERDRVRTRLDKWAAKHGLMRKAATGRP